MTWSKSRRLDGLERIRRGVLAVMLGACIAAPAVAATWSVGPTQQVKTVARALELAHDDDVIEVQPGTYPGDVAVILQRRLTIRGIGARPVFTADGRHAEGKAIWVVRDGDITIDNIEFRGARVPDRNGAGIRFERGRLSLRHCAFFDNEMGLLTANFEDARLSIEDTEFGQAPQHAGALHHLLYVGRIASFSLKGSRLHSGYIGHLVKSRARESLIARNVIVDGPRGRASYEIDLPNGGVARVLDNTIGQSPGTENPVLVAYGAEGAYWPVNSLTLEGNLLINDRAWGGSFLRVWRDRLPRDTGIAARNNRLAGPGDLDAGPGATLEGNVHVARP